MPEIVTFRSFYTEEEAVELSVLLYQKGVSNRIQKSLPTFYNQLITKDALPKAFHVQIDEEDFIKANNILENLK
jgi:hypothetical protein